MPMYVCDGCGSLENSTEGNWWFRFKEKGTAECGKALCGFCYKGVWSSPFPRKPWDGTSKVENRVPLTGEALLQHTESLFEPDSWLKDFETFEALSEESKGIVIPRNGFTLYISCGNGFDSTERKICRMTLIRSREMCLEKDLYPREYRLARFNLHDIYLIWANCKFDVRACTVTNNLVGGPSEEEFRALFCFLVFGKSEEL